MGFISTFWNNWAFENIRNLYMAQNKDEFETLAPDKVWCSQFPSEITQLVNIESGINPFVL